MTSGTGANGRGEELLIGADLRLWATTGTVDPQPPIRVTS